MVGHRPVTSSPVTPEVERLELRLDAVPDSVGRARQAVVAFAERRELAAPPDVALAVTEAVTNAVVHAYRDGATGQVRVVACALETGLLVVVRDYGCGMLPNPGSPGAGLGLAVIGALAGDMNIERPDEGGGTRVRIRFKPLSSG
jgi:serine/threonine-protein kinase RsbW/stage II sporulation protein AB (anti-sigma F factor)